MCVNEYNISQPCPSKTCVGIHSRKGKQYQHECKAIETKFPLLHIVTYINTDVNDEEQKFTFQCQYDVCNTIGRLKEIERIVKEYYDLSHLRKALRLGNKSSTIQSTLSYYSLNNEMTVTTSYATLTSFTTAITEGLSTKTDHLLYSPSSKAKTLEIFMIFETCSILFHVVIN